MSETAQSERVTLSAALNDLGFFYTLFNTLVSGPSVLSLLQMVFIDYRFVEALQWIVDGYNDITAVIGSVIEPLVAPAIAWINALFDWRLDLQPHWRPLFLLGTMLAIGWARMTWKSGARWSATAFAICGSIGALVGAIIAGLIPLSENSRLEQGIVAAAPVLFIGLSVAVPFSLQDRSKIPPLLSVGLFALVAIGLTYVPLVAGTLWTTVVTNGAGILGLSTTVLAMGLAALLVGRFQNKFGRNAARLGLILLGGFATAALIVAADALLKVLPDWLVAWPFSSAGWT
jgi:hypothetical protein